MDHGEGDAGRVGDPGAAGAPVGVAVAKWAKGGGNRVGGSSAGDEDRAAGGTLARDEFAG